MEFSVGTREQAIEADEDQAIYGSQLRSGWHCPSQNDELPAQVKDLSITPRVCAMQPRTSTLKNLRTATIPAEAYLTVAPEAVWIRFSVGTGQIMAEIVTIGLDIAKSVFQVHGDVLRDYSAGLATTPP
jgi:hypothetical protein